MPQSFDQPPDGDPTAAEIFRVFQSTTMASLEGLRLLLVECADLRAELVTIHSLHSDGDDHGVFSARQQSRILELLQASKDMQALLDAVPEEASDGGDGNA